LAKKLIFRLIFFDGFDQAAQGYMNRFTRRLKASIDSVFRNPRCRGNISKIKKSAIFGRWGVEEGREKRIKQCRQIIAWNREKLTMKIINRRYDGSQTLDQVVGEAKTSQVKFSADFFPIFR
jgi:hypothetical protein